MDPFPPPFPHLTPNRARRNLPRLHPRNSRFGRPSDAARAVRRTAWNELDALDDHERGVGVRDEGRSVQAELVKRWGREKSEDEDEDDTEDEEDEEDEEA